MNPAVLAIGLLLAFTRAAAQVPADAAAADGSKEVLVYQHYLSSVRKVGDLDVIAKSTIGHPVVGPVLITAAAMLGVPPEVVATAAGAAAASLRERSRTESKGNWDSYYFRPPKGYALCAVKVHGDSIRPQSKNRPKIYAAVGNRDEMRFTITHEKDTSSAVKLRLETMAVKSDVWDKFEQNCHFTQAARQIVPLCRGSQCNVHVTGGQWLPKR